MSNSTLNFIDTRSIISPHGIGFRPALHKKLKFSIKDFFIRCDQIHNIRRIWSHLLKKSLLENFIFCAVLVTPVHINFILIAHEIYNAFGSNLALERRGVFLYISKAFERAWLKGLLHKVKCMDIDGKFSKLVESFF